MTCIGLNCCAAPFLLPACGCISAAGTLSAARAADRPRTEAWALPPILVTPEHLPAGLDLWPGVREGIISRRAPGTGSEVVPLAPSRTWRRTLVAAASLLLLVVGCLDRDQPKTGGKGTRSGCRSSAFADPAVFGEDR